MRPSLPCLGAGSSRLSCYVSAEVGRVTAKLEHRAGSLDAGAATQQRRRLGVISVWETHRLTRVNAGPVDGSGQLRRPRTTLRTASRDRSVGIAKYGRSRRSRLTALPDRAFVAAKLRRGSARGKATTVRHQEARVVEQDDAIAEQLPALLEMIADHVCGEPIR